MFILQLFVNPVLMTEGRGSKLEMSDFGKGVFDNKNATIAYVIFRPFLWKFGPQISVTMLQSQP